MLVYPQMDLRASSFSGRILPADGPGREHSKVAG
jgi:hypothetical protein